MEKVFISLSYIMAAIFAIGAFFVSEGRWDLIHMTMLCVILGHVERFEFERKKGE